ncbi:MAG: HAMP domain-containing protein [Spirochaetales bacterium]|nr:HAMP domain-containing protein [Spirochaetales bacterium]
MKIRLSRSSTPTGLIVLTLFYILLIGLILFFSQQILSNIILANPLINFVIIAASIILPLILLGAIVVNIVKLIRERSVRRPGARLKTRLILFFAFVALFSLIPQAILSITFINSSIKFWFAIRVVDALEGGLQVCLDYYSDRVENLKSFMDSPVLPYFFSDLGHDPGAAFKRISSVNPSLNMIQVFTEGGKELFYRGDSPKARITDFNQVRGKSGFLPREEKEDLSILRAIIPAASGGRNYYVIVGTILKQEFNNYAKSITAARIAFKQLDNYKDVFGLVVVIFYIIFSFPIFLLSILVSFLLTDEIIRPIVHLEDAIQRVAEGDFSYRVLIKASDELSILVNSFNTMVAELEASKKKLVHAERHAAWQEIAKRLAHEIKNPLTPIRLSAERILKKYHGDREGFELMLDSAISAIINEVNNLDRLLIEFKEFTRLPDLKKEKVNLKDLFAEVAEIYRSVSQNVTIDLDLLNESVVLNIDPNQIKHVIGNLFKNSIHAMPEGGKIVVNGDEVRKGLLRYFRLQIMDTGTGIDEEYRDMIFNPYFTTKKDGTGLGLSIVERIVFDHNGNIWFESKKGVGTTFFIDLPFGE